MTTAPVLSDALRHGPRKPSTPVVDVAGVRMTAEAADFAESVEDLISAYVERAAKQVAAQAAARALEASRAGVRDMALDVNALRADLHALQRAAEPSAARPWEMGERAPFGALRTHRGSLWQCANRAGATAEPSPGADWLVVADGIAAIEVAPVVGDPRRTVIRVHTGAGATREVSLHVPAVVWRGTWSADTRYTKGDAVIRNGSSWVCVRGTLGGEPGKSDDWHLMSQRGKPGASPTPAAVARELASIALGVDLDAHAAAVETFGIETAERRAALPAPVSVGSLMSQVCGEAAKLLPRAAEVAGDDHFGDANSFAVEYSLGMVAMAASEPERIELHEDFARRVGTLIAWRRDAFAALDAVADAISRPRLGDASSLIRLCATAQSAPSDPRQRAIAATLGYAMGAPANLLGSEPASYAVGRLRALMDQSDLKLLPRV
jgi:hypothetical protein